MFIHYVLLEGPSNTINALQDELRTFCKDESNFYEDIDVPRADAIEFQEKITKACQETH